MKKELFIEKLKYRGVRIVDTANPNYDGAMLQDFRSLKGLIKYLDFGCKINKVGRCKHSPFSRFCCCHDCLWSAGYFKIMLDGDIGGYAKKFSVRTGFWREGKGCNLPHRMRSITCLTHHCNHDDDKRKDFRVGMGIIKKTLNDIRRKLLA